MWGNDQPNRREQSLAADDFLAASAVQEDRSVLVSPVVPDESPAILQRQTTFLQGRKVGIVVAVLNVMNAIMGSGILALPSVMAENGVVLYICLQVAMMIVVDFSLHLLVQASFATDVFDYESLGAEAMGLWGKRTVILSIIVQNTGACLSYFIVIGDIAPQLMKAFAGHPGADYLSPPPAAPPIPANPPLAPPLGHPGADYLSPPPAAPPIPAHAPAPPLAPAVDSPLWEDRKFLMCALTLLFIFPISCTPKIGLLGYASLVSFVVMLLLCFLITTEYIRLDCDPAGVVPCEPLDMATVGTDTMLALPTLCFSFVCHTAFLPVLRELKDGDKMSRTKRAEARVTQVSHWAIGLAGVCYMWSAMWGYATFGHKVDGDLWKTLAQAAPGDAFIEAVRLAFLFSVVCTIPLILFPMRKAVKEITCPDMPFSWVWHISQTAVMLAILLLIAIELPGIKAIFSVVGASSSVMLVFLLPAIIYLKTVDPARGQPRTRVGAKLMIALGFAVATASFTGVGLNGL